jgi:hypothetical protein
MAIEKLAEEVVNEVAQNFEEAAEVTRKINAAGLGYFAVGLGVGAAVGFYFGYKLNREKIRAEAYKDAEEEVDILRAVYLDKTLNATNTRIESDQNLQGVISTEKPPVEEIIEKRGYSVNVPPREGPLPAPVPILDDLPENPVGTSKSMNAGWNYEQELESRTPEAPYVIHQNEWNHSNLNYSKVTYTYFNVDDMLVDDETQNPVPHGADIVGEENLKFGHGSDDSEIVYVRNDRLEMDMQISRIDRSFEEDVLGLHGGLMEDDDDDDDDDDS